MSDTLLPPIPPGGVGNSGFNFGSGGELQGTPPLPPLGTLPGLPALPPLSGDSSTAPASDSGASGAGGASGAKTIKADPFILKLAFMALGIIIIAGAIYTYRGNLDFRVSSPTPKFGFK